MEYRMVHIGLNCGCEEKAAETARLLCALFNLKTRETDGAIFADPYFECMKKPWYGENGHIGIGTDDVAAAVEDLKAKGVEFLEESAGYDKEGRLRLIYFKESIMGFSLHLIRE